MYVPKSLLYMTSFTRNVTPSLPPILMSSLFMGKRGLHSIYVFMFHVCCLICCYHILFNVNNYFVCVIVYFGLCGPCFILCWYVFIALLCIFRVIKMFFICLCSQTLIFILFVRLHIYKSRSRTKTKNATEAEQKRKNPKVVTVQKPKTIRQAAYAARSARKNCKNLSAPNVGTTREFAASWAATSPPTDKCTFTSSQQHDPIALAASGGFASKSGCLCPCFLPFIRHFEM